MSKLHVATFTAERWAVRITDDTARRERIRQQWREQGRQVKAMVYCVACGRLHNRFEPCLR